MQYKNSDIYIIKKQIKSKKYKIISFDIFDTLLLRPYAKPTDLFKHLEKIYNKNNFAQARIKAEQSARLKNKNQEDITIHDIYLELPNHYSDMKNLEIALEKQILTVNHEIKELYDLALENADKVIIVSDMYLTKDILTDILNNKGYKNYHNLYVSSEYKMTKHSGNLFKHILKDLNINPSSILHIGDNHHSDYKMATHNKIKAFYYEKVLDRLLKEDITIRLYYENNKDSLGTSIIVGVLSIKLINKDNDYWRYLGYKFGGILGFFYIQWIISNLAPNISQIMFIARDGYILQKIFDFLNQNKNITSEYLYANRTIAILCFLNTGNYSNTKIILDFYKDKNEFLKTHTPNINQNNFQEGIDFIKQHYSIYSELSKELLKNYNNYLEKLNIAPNIAIVDTLSSFLTSQNFLDKILEHKNINIIGYYFLLLKGYEKNYIDVDKVKSMQHGDNCFLSWDFIELLFTSPELPIKSIDNFGNPVYFETNLYEEERINIYPKISEGILDFTKDIKSIFNNYNLYLDSADIVNFFNTLSTHPNKKDYEMLSKIKHSQNPGNYEYIPLMGSDFNFRDLFPITLKFLFFNINLTEPFTKKPLYKFLPFITILYKKPQIKIKLFNLITLKRYYLNNHS
jgi:predicted HAD superfamily hydrolase